MVVLNEEFAASAELNEKLCFGRAWPLPRLQVSPPPQQDKYEVIVVGAGPAGLFLTLQLARYGLPSHSLLCIDSKDEHTKVGHADGINARTIEVLRTFGLESEVLREGNEFSEFALWATSEDGQKLERKYGQRVNFHPVRFTQLNTMHQGRLEWILKRDLERYHETGVQYSTRLVSVEIDEEGDAGYPLVATLEHKGQTKTARAKHLVGADGAHSVVRRCVGIELEGDVTDNIWGVIDFIVDTDFPDIRRAINYEGKVTALTIPRERLSNGIHTTRLYIDMTQDQDNEGLVNGVEKSLLQGKPSWSDDIRKRRSAITPEKILEKGAELMCHHRFKMKEGTQPFWWATYAVGQRLANRYVVDDSKGNARIFIMGDACHTHTPRQGQGLNISMADAYNLAWKLCYSIFGLTPSPQVLLHNYESERRPEAEKVVFFDKRWNEKGVDIQLKLAEGFEQIWGCGVEYGPSLTVAEERTGEENYPVKGKEYIQGILRTGRRLPNVKVKRFADGTFWNVQDDLISNGRYRIVVICGDDFPKQERRSLTAVVEACKIVEKYAEDMIDVIVLQPDMEPSWHWKDMSACVKEQAEMRLHCADKEVYEFYGVDVSKGAVLLVRPDGMVAIIENLEEISKVDSLLGQVLVTR